MFGGAAPPYPQDWPATARAMGVSPAYMQQVRLGAVGRLPAPYRIRTPSICIGVRAACMGAGGRMSKMQMHESNVWRLPRTAVVSTPRRWSTWKTVRARHFPMPGRSSMLQTFIRGRPLGWEVGHAGSLSRTARLPAALHSADSNERGQHQHTSLTALRFQHLSPGVSLCMPCTAAASRSCTTATRLRSIRLNTVAYRERAANCFVN